VREVTCKSIDDNTKNNVQENTLDGDKVCHFIKVLEYKSVLVIFLKGLMQNRLSYSASISEPIIESCQEAMPKITTRSFSETSIYPAIIESIINEIEANNRPDVDYDETQQTC